MGAIVFFGLILFVMGGVTAYTGDRLGSYIGKKRHSTFGLRPRHTAMLWTVVSGGVIAVGTLLLFLALNGAFETALIRGPQLLAANSDLASRNKALLKRNAAAARQAAQDGEAAREAQAKAAAAQKTLVSVTGQLDQTKAILGQSQAVLAESRTVLARRQAALASAQTRLADARRGLGSTRAGLHIAQIQVRAARSSLRDAKRQAAVAELQVVQANKAVLKLGVKQDTLSAENSRLASLNHVQENLLQVSQGRTLIFQHDEELGRTVVSAQQDPAALRRELSVFLDQIELTARQRGASGEGNAPVLLLPALTEASGGIRYAGTSSAREAALDALSQNISAQSGLWPSVVVVADARFNTFRGEPVKLDLKPYGNALIFPKGAVIARGTVNGMESEDEILRHLQAFLTGQVRTEALKRGIIPAHDPQTGMPLVGRPIGSEVWVNLVKQIQQAGPEAKITASVAEDTYSGDLLHLKFRVSGG
jgi:hypothetical protein